MKKQYVTPAVSAEVFETNEFCATTCGKVNGKYVFTCDAPKGNVHITYKGTDYNLGGYKPCSKKHETDGPDEYYDGWVDYNKNNHQDGNEPNQLIWVEGLRESNFFGYIYDVSANDYHASASLTRAQIDVERS